MDKDEGITYLSRFVKTCVHCINFKQADVSKNAYVYFLFVCKLHIFV